MAPSIYIATLLILFGTILAIFALRSYAAAQQAKARIVDGEAWRQIGEKASVAEAETAAALGAIQASLGSMATRLTAVEKILSDVG